MNREHTLPGYIAIALALLYPLYWLVMLKSGFASESLLDAFRSEVEGLDGWDALFVLIGVMEISLYLSLRGKLKQHFNSGLAMALLLLMAIFVAIFTACVGFDVILALAPEMAETNRETLVQTAMVTHLSSGYILSWLSLFLSVALLVNHAAMDWMLKLFALLLLVASAMSITILLAPLSVLIYPLAFIALGLHFLRGDLEVEVV